MARTNPTRINLINLRKNIVLAKKGYDLLKRKREVLVIEFLKVLQDSTYDRNYMLEVLNNAYKTTAIASTYIGDFELEQASAFVDETNPVHIKIKNIMGVKVPEIQSGAQSQSETLNMMQQSIAVNDVSDSFKDLQKIVIDIAKREQSMKRIVLEIEKVKRRVNALDYILLPNLKKEAKYIQFRLEEIDRDTFSALKHVKKKLSGKNQETQAS